MDHALNSSQHRLRSLLWILCSTLLISGSALIAHTICQTLSERRPHDDRYLVRAIVQPEERLPTDQIVALLNLSADVPCNLYNIDPKEAQAALLSCPLVRSAKVKRLPPDALYVDVTLRTPCALVADYPGMTLDEEGVCFPYLKSFEGPKVCLGEQVHTDACHMAIRLLQIIPHISWVDVSRLHHPRYGLREIVVGLENGNLLRMPTAGYEEALANYQKLERSIEGPLIIDLRLPNLAYYQQIGK